MICPLDYRYGRVQMKKIFEESNRLNYMLKVEGAIALAHAVFGNIPEEDAKKIAEVADTSHVKIERVKEIEAEVKHDVMAVVKALTEVAGASGKYVHLG
ncbi:MAG: adenylosuccinate lyase, partial [Thermoplasmata archaeon]